MWSALTYKKRKRNPKFFKKTFLNCSFVDCYFHSFGYFRQHNLRTYLVAKFVKTRRSFFVQTYSEQLLIIETLYLSPSISTAGSNLV
jgi:hypothetical protein